MAKIQKKIKNLSQAILANKLIAGLILLFCSGLAFYLANSPLHNFYTNLVNTPISFNLGSFSVQASLHYVINEAFMALFFFLVGMEIKIELIEGELSSPKKAAFPLMAAIGGSLIPAGIFYFLNQGLITEKGWGIPMATDIAFAIAVISLLPHKVPFALKVFLLSVAIIDDIIAVMVIALFYSDQISGPHLAGVLIVALCLSFYFKIHTKNKFLLIFLACALWFCMYKSGIHATLSGVILGFLIPYRKRWTEVQVLNNVQKVFKDKKETSLSQLRDLVNMMEDTQSFLKKLIIFWTPYVYLIVMPLFAFANAGVAIGEIDMKTWAKTPVSLGILLGLCVGKPIGITVFSYLTCLLKLAQKPDTVSWIQILCVGCLSGIGFTMSLFILNLGFPKDMDFYSYAKMSVLLASLISAVVGLGLLSFGKTVPVKERKGHNSFS